MQEINELKKYKILNRLLVVIEQEEFSEADVKDAVDLLHKNLSTKQRNSLTLSDEIKEMVERFEKGRITLNELREYFQMKNIDNLYANQYLEKVSTE